MDITKLKKYYIDNKLLVHCILIAILFFVNCFVPGFGILGYLIVGAMIILSNMSDGFSTLVFSIPFCCVDGYLSIFLFFICFMIFLVKGFIKFKKDKKRISLGLLISICLFCIYSFIPFGEYTIGMFVKIGITLILVCVLILFIHYPRELNLKFNISVLAIGMLISSAFFLTYFVSPYIHDRPMSTADDYFIRFSALLINPNTLAMMSEICLALLTYFLIKDKFEWTDIIAYIIFSVLGISTMSKTFLILYFVMLVILIIYLIKKYKTKTMWWIGGFALVFLVAFFIKSDFFLTYINRFMFIDFEDLTFGEILNVITTYRYDLWCGVLEYLFMNPVILIFGHGFGAPLIEELSAHNFYITLVYELGLIGAGIFVTMFVFLFLEKKRTTGKLFGKAVWVPIIIIGLLMMVEDLFLYIY